MRKLVLGLLLLGAASASAQSWPTRPVRVVAAYPAGVFSDRGDRIAPLALGMVALIAADGVLAGGNDLLMVALGVSLWGLHMGLTQGLLAALVADAAPAALRGTAFGVFNLASGMALLIASWAAGALWDLGGDYAAFSASGFCALAALAGLMALRRKLAGGGLAGGSR